jgi:hypothetical protein
VKALRAISLASVAAGVLALPAAWALDRAAGRELLPVLAADAATVAVNRELRSEGDPVAALYGAPAEKPVRLLFVPAEKILVPEEDRSLALYMKQEGDHPLQAQTLYFFGGWATAGFLLSGLAGLAVASLLSRRAKAAAPAA